MRNDARSRPPRWNRLYWSVTADRTWRFWPAGPARRVVSSNPTTCAIVISDLIVVTVWRTAVAQRASRPWQNPVDGAVPPVRSAINSTHRATGTC